MSHPIRSRALALASLSVLLVGATGCASVRAAAARDAHLRDALGAHVYPMTCLAVWPDVLRLLASKGFALVGADRIVAGQPPQSGIGNFFSQGFQTQESFDGGLVVASDWNSAWVRYRASGTVVPPGGCTVTFTRFSQPDTDDPSRTTSEKDWEMALELLRRVDPAAAAGVEAGVPRPSP